MMCMNASIKTRGETLATLNEICNALCVGRHRGKLCTKRCACAAIAANDPWEVNSDWVYCIFNCKNCLPMANTTKLNVKRYWN